MILGILKEAIVLNAQRYKKNMKNLVLKDDFFVKVCSKEYFRPTLLGFYDFLLRTKQCSTLNFWIITQEKYCTET